MQCVTVASAEDTPRGRRTLRRQRKRVWKTEWRSAGPARRQEGSKDATDSPNGHRSRRTSEKILFRSRDIATGFAPRAVRQALPASVGSGAWDESAKDSEREHKTQPEAWHATPNRRTTNGSTARRGPLRQGGAEAHLERGVRHAPEDADSQSP
ncbi:hypothetical protein TRVL_08287 [Trypanosoma vivax]|nr:hypothetical protein TRVL_08287 [Trypanosoma vivax]